MPRKKDKEKLDRILDSALALFSERGFNTTTMEEIAERAGIATGTVYLYVRNKEDILEKLFDRFYEIYAGRLEQKIVSLANVAEKIRALIQSDLKVLFESEERIKLFLIELRQSPFALVHIKKRIFEHYRRFIRVIHGDTEQDLVEILAITIGGIVENFAYYIWLTPGESSTRILAKQNTIMRIIEKIVLQSV